MIGIEYILAGVAALILVSIIANKVSGRLGLPALLIFILVGMRRSETDGPSDTGLGLSAVLAGSGYPQKCLLVVQSIIQLLLDATGVIGKNGEKDEAVQM
jgi:hypothetical protein